MNKIADFLALLALLAGLAGIAVSGDKIYVLASSFSVGYLFARYIALERRVKKLEKKD